MLDPKRFRGSARAHVSERDGRNLSYEKVVIDNPSEEWVRYNEARVLAEEERVQSELKQLGLVENKQLRCSKCGKTFAQQAFYSHTGRGQCAIKV